MRERFIRAASLEGFSELVRSYGLNPNTLLAQVGLQPAQLREPDRFIRYEDYLTTVELAAKASGDPVFGLKLSQKQSLSTLGLMGAYMSRQPSIQEALKIAEKYLYLHVEGLSLHLSQPASTPQKEALCELRFINLSQSGADYPHKAQMTVGAIYKVLRELTGTLCRIHRISLRQPSPEQGLTLFKQVFNCDLVFGAEYDALYFPASVLALKPAINDHLIDQLLSQALFASATTQRDHPERQALDQVESAIRVLLSTGECNKENVATCVNLHPKKLQRLLKDQNTSFRALLEEVRKKEAMRQLQQQQVSLTTLALQLGYSELSVFSRCFKAWFGLSPSEWQRQASNQAL